MTTNGRLVRKNAFSLLEPQINAEGVHLWPFDLSFPVDLLFFRLNNRHDLRLNRHDYFEIMYIESGAFVYQIQDRLLPVKKGDVVVISSTQYHTMHANAKRPASPVNCAALYFLPGVLKSVEQSGGEEAEYLMPFLLQDDAFPHVVPGGSKINAEIFALMKRIGKELPAGNALGRLAVKTYLRMILLLLVKHYSLYSGTRDAFRRKQQNIEQLRPVFDFIETRYGEPITVRDAARVAGVSQSHFMRFFRQVTGQSFIAYLNHFRIAKAQELLIKSDSSIAEISQSVGFCDQSYFGSIFRRTIKITPRQYKNKYRRDGAQSG